jgi:hypothetical protein
VFYIFAFFCHCEIREMEFKFSLLGPNIIHKWQYNKPPKATPKNIYLNHSKTVVRNLLCTHPWGVRQFYLVLRGVFLKIFPHSLIRKSKLKCIMKYFWKTVICIITALKFIISFIAIYVTRQENFGGFFKWNWDLPKGLFRVECLDL